MPSFRGGTVLRPGMKLGPANVASDSCAQHCRMAMLATDRSAQWS